jgi:5-methyltetrahydropteroyltriglutamate--homocysteine methyltransferase
LSKRIHTTHVGSLPRPQALLDMMRKRAAGDAVDNTALHTALRDGVRDIVARQVAAGIDYVSDGEFSKPSYATYVSDRLSGFGGEWKGSSAADLRAFPEFAQHLIEIGGVVPKAGGACCVGPVAPKGSHDLDDDLANLRLAVEKAKPVGAFMNAASPGVVAVFQKNEFYPSEDAYIEAVAEALRLEYEAIVGAGLMLQIDSPDLAMSRHLIYAKLDEAAFVKVVARNVAALNQATRNIPPEKMRMHVCWGNYAGPHHLDIPLATIAKEVLKARPSVLLLEAANPRHGHEWTVFEEMKLPDDKIVCPGVVDSTSNYIEHPELVAQRLIQYAKVVGRDRVMAGSDCGFSTFSGFPTVYPDIVWKKMEAMVEGARIASKQLWNA